MTTPQTSSTSFRVPDADLINGASVQHIGARGETMTITEAREEIASLGGDRENVYEHEGYLWNGEKIIGEPID